eukprot:1905480-Pyramimonas_sp.AAC.1
MSAPPIDCILQRARLVHLRRLLLHGPVELHALLHVQVKGGRLPWTRQILSGLALLRQKVIRHSEFFLPDPRGYPRAWGDFIRGARWRGN